MNNLQRYFAIMRSFRAKQESAAKEKAAQRNNLEQYTGSKYFVEKYDEVQKQFTLKTTQNRNEAAAKIKEVCNTMRISAKKNLIEAPTQEMSATLGLLKLADNLSTNEVRAYAESFKNCPLALKILGQIAKSFNIHVAEPNFDIVNEKINNLENGALMFIENFTDPTENNFFNMTYSRFFMDNPGYENSDWTTEQSEQAWLHRMTEDTNIECYEENAPTPTPEVTYKFKDIDDMLTHLGKATAGMDERAKEVTENEILQATPDSQTSKYRYYKATGEKLAFEEE